MEDVERVGRDVKTAIDSSIKSLDKTISEPWGILNDMRNSMDSNIVSNRQVVEGSEEHLSEKLDKLDSKLSNKLDAFTAKPPVRETIHRIAKETWQLYTLLGFAIATVALCVAVFFWQEGRIEQCRISDIKYHFIQMCGGVSSDGLDKIEGLFQDPEKVKHIEKMVRDHEKRVEETARPSSRSIASKKSSTSLTPKTPSSHGYYNDIPSIPTRTTLVEMLYLYELYLGYCIEI